jgi:hypothetical protein
MASFPTTNITYANRSPGQAIASAHINSLQDEVAAIELGYLTGTARLNAGNSTVATLSVTGNSTLASTVNITGTILLNGSSGSTAQFLRGDMTWQTITAGSTFADLVVASTGLTISTGILRQNAIPAWSVENAVSIAVSSNSGGNSAGITFDTQNFTKGTATHSTTTNSSRVSVTSTGLYSVSFHGRTNSANSAQNGVLIRLDDTTTLLGQRLPAIAASENITINLTGLIRVPSAGYLTVVVSSNAQASTWGGAALEDRVRFMGYFVG